MKGEIDQDEAESETKETIKHIGEKLKQFRLEAHLTQSDVAFYTFSDKCLVSNIERGVCKNITILTLVRFCLLFNKEIINFIE